MPITVSIENILDCERRGNGLLYFQVKFKNYSHKYNVWLPIHLTPQELILDYLTKVRNNSKKYPNHPFLNSKTKVTEDKREFVLKELATTPNILSNFAKQLTTNQGIQGLQLTPSQIIINDQELYKLRGNLCLEKVNQLLKFVIVEKLIQDNLKMNDILCDIEVEINLRNTSHKAIRVANNVNGDTEFLQSFKYNYTDTFEIPENLRHLESEFLGVSCSCSKGMCELSSCNHENAPAYNEDGRLKSEFMRDNRKSVYECNKNCACGPNCPNRIVQNPSNVQLELFCTINNCGWGVRTLQSIKEGTFVTRYIGKLITYEQVETEEIGNHYIFDIDIEVDESKDIHRKHPNFGDYAIDAAKVGNISRFINHSCEPNLITISVHIESSDPRLHEIAFFALHDIEAGEQLCINYGKYFITDEPCFCGAKSCRKKMIDEDYFNSKENFLEQSMARLSVGNGSNISRSQIISSQSINLQINDTL